MALADGDCANTSAAAQKEALLISKSTASSFVRWSVKLTSNAIGTVPDVQEEVIQVGG